MGTSAMQDDVPSPADLMNRAKAAYVGGKFEEAAAAAADVLSIQPRNMSASKLRARALTGAGKHEEACVAWKNAAELSPDSVEMFLNLARAYRKCGRFSDVASASARLIELEAEHQDGQRLLVQAIKRAKSSELPAIVWTGLAKLPSESFLELTAEFEGQKRFKDLALAVLAYREGRVGDSKIEAESTRVFKMLMARGRSFEQWGDEAAAADCYGAAAMLDVDDGSASRSLRRIVKPVIAKARDAQKEKRFDEAMEDYEKALGMDPANPAALAGIARVHEQRSAWADASKCWRRLVEVEPDNTTAWLRLGLDQERCQQYAAAIEALEKARAPEQEAVVVEARERIARQASRAARVAYASEQFDVAGDMIVIAEAIEGSSEPIVRAKRRIVRALRAICKESYANGQYSVVIANSRILRALGDNDAATWISVARAGAAQHEYAVSLDAWKAAEIDRPDHPAVLLGIARAYAAMNQIEDAIAAAERATQVEQTAEKARQLLESLRDRRSKQSA